MPREPVDEIVLTAVRLVRNHHNVPTLRQRRLLPAPALRKELLNRRENHPARRPPQPRPQIRPTLRLLRPLPQHIRAARKRREQLAVQIVAVRQHHNRRIAHPRIPRNRPSVKRHRQTLARTLRVPDHPDPTIPPLPARAARLVTPARLRNSRLLRSPHRLLHRVPHRVKLVIPSQLLRRRPAVVLEHDEIAYQRQQTRRLAHALQQHLQLRHMRIVQLLARYRPPRLEPLHPRRQRPQPRPHAVRHDQ